MERAEYPAMLPKLAPAQAADVLNDRVRQVGKLNTAIADWLQERSRLEEQYAAGLRKLARKPMEDVDLGIFSVPWSTMTNSMDTLAESHASLASKIQVDVEAPIRDFAVSNREMQAMSTIQGNLGSMARDIERAQQRTEKLQGKGEKAEASKVANATSDLDTAKAAWDSQAPYVFETLQSLDETRVNTLRDLLTQLQTLEVDQVEKNRVAAEQCLNVLLNVETQDEIKTFALKTLSGASGRPSANRPSRASFIPSMPSMPGSSSSTPQRAREGSASNSNALTTIPSNAEDDASQISGTPEPTKKGGFKGLKRLGTVVSRRRESKQTSSLPATSESPERKAKGRTFGLGRLGRNKGSYGLEPPQEEPSGSLRPRSPFRMGSEVMESTEVREQPSSPSNDRPPQLDLPHMNGSSSALSPTLNVPNGSHQGDLADLDPPKPTEPEPSRVPTFAEPQRDSEGYSVPPQQLDPISQAEADLTAAERPEPQFNVNIRNAPIREEGGEAALASVANKLAPPPTQRRAGTVRGRRDARNSAVISTYSSSDQATPEASSAAVPSTTQRAFEPTSALAPVADPVVAPAVQPPSAPSTSPGTQSPLGGFSPVGAGNVNAFSPFSGGAEPHSPIRPSSRAAVGADHAGDNQSIRSGRSTASQGMRHPELIQPGLSSSIIETISVRFDSKQVSNASLIGEVALAYNATDFNASHGHETIRLEHFSSLDKVAPNPAFIHQVADKEGEYSINLAQIAKTQIAFKYQLRHDEAEQHIPLLLTPAYKTGPTQTDVIVNYSLYPGFTLQGRENLALSNVTIGLILEGAKATNCMTKPTGTFNREKNLVFWQLGDITLTPGAAPEKLLARFVTESEAKGGSIDAKWEIHGDGTPGIGSPIAVSMSGQGVGEGADPFADEGAPAGGSWKGVPVVRKLTSGSYVAKS
ncbi:Hypothetical predicted protein [Lecanosticta acicola]|uniref:MHD domain-containing protein n=1 Tax=Lecanosticta acicola TaxID=111012 RepID=A0AAI9E903_9PEZI|nr:Hypothetical predicted protein [Lecanosticta acicola]